MLDVAVLRRCAVLDVETGPDVDAMLNAVPRPTAEADLAALHRLRLAVVLTFDQIGGAPPTNLRFERFADVVREQELVVRIDRALPEANEANRLVTFNGGNWDLPMIMQRAAATWCFSASRVTAWSDARADRHHDMMRRGCPRSNKGWSSLADRAAAIGIDMRIARGKAVKTRASIRRRCTADVAATYLLYISAEAVRRSDARFFAGGWLALAEVISADPAIFRDIRYLAEHPMLDGCRALLGGRPTFSTNIEPTLATLED